MPRQRSVSSASTMSSKSGGENQELGSMYDYLAKIILLGPSGCGKSCLLHRFVRGEYKILTSQTIGVEFSSKIVRVGNKRIKLQLWDTAGQERFRSVTRSYYRGATGALLIYDVGRWETFAALGEFLGDARALGSPELTVVLVGNKCDLVTEGGGGEGGAGGGGGGRGNGGGGSSAGTDDGGEWGGRGGVGGMGGISFAPGTHYGNGSAHHRRNHTGSTMMGGVSGGGTGTSTAYGSVASTFSTSRFADPPSYPPLSSSSTSISSTSTTTASSSRISTTMTNPQPIRSSNSSIYSTTTESTSASYSSSSSDGAETASIASTITPSTYQPTPQHHLHHHPHHTNSSSNRYSSHPNGAPSGSSNSHHHHHHQPPLRQVTPLDTHAFASSAGIPYATETSALTGENVDEVFTRLARMILTKIELGEVDPDDPSSGIQYGDFGMGYDEGDGGGGGGGRGRRGREWDGMFGGSGGSGSVVGVGGRRGGCC